MAGKLSFKLTACNLNLFDQWCQNITGCVLLDIDLLLFGVIGKFKTVAAFISECQYININFIYMYSSAVELFQSLRKAEIKNKALITPRIACASNLSM